jgi:hypothetical protein
MKRFCLSVVLLCMFATMVFAQGSVAPNPSPNTQATASGSDADIRGAFPTTLAKSIDTKKLKEGDVILCQTAGALHSSNGLMIPSGAKVIGHVTKVESRSKGGANTELAIAFDKIEVTKGKEYSMKGVLQAIGPSLGSSGPDTGSMSGSGQLMSGGSAQGGSSAGTSAPPVSGMQVSEPRNGTPILNAQTKGAAGMKNLELDSNGVITSPEKDIKLQDGTQMLIRAEISVPTK